MQPLIGLDAALEVGAIGADPLIVFIATMGHWYSSHEALHTGPFQGVLNKAIFGPCTGSLQRENIPYL